MKKKGATCYMNSVLQQFYINEEFRNGILLTNIEELLFEKDISILKKKENQINKEILKVENDIEKEILLLKKIEIENELKNLLNKDLNNKKIISKKSQDIYIENNNEENNDNINNEENNKKKEENKEENKNNKNKEENKKKEEKLKKRIKEDDNINLLYQLQILFGYLEYGTKKYFDTLNFCLSYKDFDGKSIDLGRQSDSYEFANLFLDKIETSLKNSFIFKNLIKNIYSGNIKKY
jgi:hypothetical protein